MAEETVAREETAPNSNCNLSNHVSDGENGGVGSAGSASKPPAPPSSAPKVVNKGKSCKGTLYYSSTLKTNGRNPLCVGLTRSLPQVPRYVVEESETEASKEGRSLTDFKYGCLGYSVYTDRKNQPGDESLGSPKELPICVGIEVLVDRRVTNAASAPTHIHNREDGHGVPQRRTQKPAHLFGNDFLNRFSRNANLVAMGVVKNLHKVGNHIKDRVDDILYPYRRPPK